MTNTYSKNFTVTLCVSDRGREILQFLNTANSEDWHLLDLRGRSLDRDFEGFQTHWTVKRNLGEFQLTYGVGFDENKNRRLIKEILSIARTESLAKAVLADGLAEQDQPQAESEQPRMNELTLEEIPF
jgi:hypothetical protein